MTLANPTKTSYQCSAPIYFIKTRITFCEKRRQIGVFVKTPGARSWPAFTQVPAFSKKDKILEEF